MVAPYWAKRLGKTTFVLIRPHGAAGISFAAWPVNASSWKAIAFFTLKAKQIFEERLAKIS
jgi:hypothetical protein